MESSADNSKLRKLFDTCVSLQWIRNKMTDPEIEKDAATKLRRQSKRKSEQLTRDLKSVQFRGPLGEVMQAFQLTPEEFQVLAVLLQRQMRCEDPALEGRLILASIFDTAYEVLAHVDLLYGDSPLRASGLVVLEDVEEHPEDLLETRFVLSEQGLEGFRQEIVGSRPATPTAVEPARPYRSNRDLLVDLRVLHNLHLQRSERVFHDDRWNRLHPCTFEPGRLHTERIEKRWARLRDRLDCTPNGSAFPMVRLMRENSLGEEETMIVIHLLFKELFEGNAYADVADLLRLVSRDELELIQNRRLVADSAPLRKAEILRIEPMLEGRTLTGESYLADWVPNYAFGAATPSADIQADERIDWHVYLEELDDTKGFFQDLDAN